MLVSKDLNENIKKHMVNSDPLDIDFYIQVRKFDANFTVILVDAFSVIPLSDFALAPAPKSGI